jgi:hypothetical protein
MQNLGENILVIPQNMGRMIVHISAIASILKSQIAGYGQFCHGGHRSVHYRA